MSGSALQLDNRQVPAAGDEMEIELKLRAWLARYERLWGSTSGSTWPFRPWFPARPSVGWQPQAMVDFVRRTAAQRHVRSMLVVPTNEERELAAERVAMNWNQCATRPFTLQRADEPLDDR